MNSLVELVAHVEADVNTHPDFGPKLNSRQCPVLQDINGDVSDILAHSSRRSVEETIGQLIDCSNLCDLRETRLEIFLQAVGSLIEHEDPANIDVHTYKLKQRRGVKAAATTAMDIVLLFKFLCDTGCEFPVSVLANNRLTTHNPPQQQVHFGGSDSSSPQTIPPPSSRPDPPAMSYTQHSQDDLPCAQRVNSAVSDSSVTTPHRSDESQDSSCLLDLFRCSTPDDHCLEGSGGVLPPPISPPYDVTLGDQLETRNLHTRCCCDHGRAIIDMRCTIDTMQMEITQLQAKLTHFNVMDHMQGGLAGEQPVPRAPVGPPLDPAGALARAFPSPPESQFHSVASIASSSVTDVTDMSDSLLSKSFSDIFQLRSVQNEANSVNCGSPLESSQRSAPADDGAIAGALSASCVGSTVQPDDSDREAVSVADVAYLRGEMESLKIQVIGIDERLGETEMSCAASGDALRSLEKLPRANDLLGKGIADIKGRVETNARNIKKLMKKGKAKPVNSNDHGNQTVVNVATSNRFAALATGKRKGPHERTSNVTKRKQKKHTDANINTRPLKKNVTKSVSVKVIGASMIKGQGKLVSDEKLGIRACCYPKPGYTAEKIERRLPGMISEHDDAIVLLGATNNVPRDTVATCITRLNSLVKAARAQNRRAHIVVSELPIRFDDITLNNKIERINGFVRHMCSKSGRLHAMNHANMFRSDFGRDGLHFSEAGKEKFAGNTKLVLQNIFGPQ